MAVDPQSVAALLEKIGAFSIRDRRVLRAQDEMRHKLASVHERNGELSPAYVKKYRAVIEKYFIDFHQEAGRHIRELDRRLETLAQKQFNATAERGVAARRAEITQSILRDLEHL